MKICCVLTQLKFLFSKFSYIISTSPTHYQIYYYFFPYFLQIPTNQTDCKILNQIYNFQFQCKPINPNRLLGFFWVKKRHVGGWRKRKRYLMEIGKKQVDEKKSEENKKLVWVGYICHHIRKFTKIKITIALRHNKLSQYFHNNWGVKYFIYQNKIK